MLISCCACKLSSHCTAFTFSYLYNTHLLHAWFTLPTAFTLYFPKKHEHTHTFSQVDMCTHTHSLMHTHTHTHSHTLLTHTHMNTLTHAHAHTLTHAHAHTLTHVHRQTCMHTCTHNVIYNPSTTLISHTMSHIRKCKCNFSKNNHGHNFVHTTYSYIVDTLSYCNKGWDVYNSSFIMSWLPYYRYKTKHYELLQISILRRFIVRL